MNNLQRREVLFGLAGVALAQTIVSRTGAAFAAEAIKPGPSSALIVVDVQNRHTLGFWHTPGSGTRHRVAGSFGSGFIHINAAYQNAWCTRAISSATPVVHLP